MSGVRSPRRKGFPPNLYLDSKGYFSYRNPQNGKRKGVGSDKATAFREARQANAALAALTPSSLSEWAVGIEQLSLADWVLQYKAAWIKKSNPAANTLRNATSCLNKIAAADFAWMSLKNVATSHVAALLSSAESNSGPSSALVLRARLSDVFRMAETQGLIDAGKNPVTATYTPDREVKRERLSLEQFEAARAAAVPWLANAMCLALLTAQRREDIAALKFSDVRDGHLYIIPGKLQGKVRLQQDVAIRLDAINMSIGDAIRQCRDNVVSQFMVHHQRARSAARPGDPVSLNGLTNTFRTTLVTTGVVASEGRTLPSFHEIRSLSERLYKEQRGAAFAQAMLGHKNAKMTAEYDDLRGSGWQVVSAKS